MAPSALLDPDVLVLAGGGIVGEAWMHGVLAGIEDAARVDFRDVEAFVGTSAGSIVAARLAAGRRPPRPKAGAARRRRRRGSRRRRAVATVRRGRRATGDAGHPWATACTASCATRRGSGGR